MRVLKVGEVRKLVDDYSEKQLRLLITELYKLIPKRIKEEQQIDALIRNPRSRIEQPRPATRKVPEISALCAEAEAFIENAYAQNYYLPNSFIPKRERPNWRFIARRIFKGLAQAGENLEGRRLAAAALTDLYYMLCHSCAYVLFSAYDPFESAGISQEEFFRQVLRLRSKIDGPREFIRDAIRMVIEHPLGRFTLYETLLQVILGFLNTVDMKEMAIDLCNELGSEQRPKQETDSWSDSSPEVYEARQRRNNLATMGFFCYSSLTEFDRAIEYFQHHYSERNPEISLYVLLRLLQQHSSPEFWIRTYENAIKKGVSPRRELRELYTSVRAGGQWA